MTGPDTDFERKLLTAAPLSGPDGSPLYLVGVDEVGRGALAGPVAVGACAVSVDTLERSIPQGLNDSKLVSALTREWLAPEVRKWSVATAVGQASAQEIDAYGIVAALRLAGQRALAELADSGVKPAVIILDGKHNWLHAAPDLFAPEPPFDASDIPVTMLIKADQLCTSVAAASIVAKVWRDAEMQRLSAQPEYAEYGFSGHKGYGASSHLLAIARHGASDAHRRSWKLPQTIVASENGR